MNHTWMRQTFNAIISPYGVGRHASTGVGVGR